MVPFRPIEANNNRQMVPRAESIREGNYTNAAVARNDNHDFTTSTCSGEAVRQRYQAVVMLAWRRFSFTESFDKNVLAYGICL